MSCEFLVACPCHHPTFHPGSLSVGSDKAESSEYHVSVSPGEATEPQSPPRVLKESLDGLPQSRDSVYGSAACEESDPNLYESLDDGRVGSPYPHVEVSLETKHEMRYRMLLTHEHHRSRTLQLYMSVLSDLMSFFQ